MMSDAARKQLQAWQARFTTQTEGQPAQGALDPTRAATLAQPEPFTVGQFLRPSDSPVRSSVEGAEIAQNTARQNQALAAAQQRRAQQQQQQQEAFAQQERYEKQQRENPYPSRVGQRFTPAYTGPDKAFWDRKRKLDVAAQQKAIGPGKITVPETPGTGLAETLNQVQPTNRRPYGKAVPRGLKAAWPEPRLPRGRA